MSDAEARFFIEQMSNAYKKRKMQDNLYSSGDCIPENIITTYCTYVEKPQFSIIIEEYKKEYIYNEARIERNVSQCEQDGLGIMYDYIQKFDFEKDYFNIFVTSMLLHQKLYSKCPGPEFGGKLRDTEVILHDLHLEMMTARQAKEFFNSFIPKSDEVFIPLDSGNIFTFINECIKITTELIKAQPFTDGNKRTFRALLSLLLKKIQIPPIYIDNSERFLYKEALIEALTNGNYDHLTRFYYYKICDAIVTLDIKKSILNPDKILKIGERDF